MGLRKVAGCSEGRLKGDPEMKVRMSREGAGA